VHLHQLLSLVPEGLGQRAVGDAESFLAAGVVKGEGLGEVLADERPAEARQKGSEQVQQRCGECTVGGSGRSGKASCRR